MDNNTRWDSWYDRGVRDAKRGKPPIFRSTTRDGTFAVCEGYDDEVLSESEAGNLYLAGYDSTDSNETVGKYE